MSAKIYYFPEPITEFERRGGCLLRVGRVVFEDIEPDPPTRDEGHEDVPPPGDNER